MPLNVPTCLATMAALIAGCGLIDPDVADFDLSLPEKEFSIDAAAKPLGPEATTAINTSCAGLPNLCRTLATAACPQGQCTGSCSATTMTCELTIPVRLFTTINLASERPELQQIEDRAFVSVTIDSIGYGVSRNTLNVETPPMSIYIAPAAVMDPANATAIGTLPAIPPRMTLPLGTPLDLTADGRAAMVRFMKDFRAPFNLIVATNIVIGAGDMIPSGQLAASVKIQATAGL